MLAVGTAQAEPTMGPWNLDTLFRTPQWEQTEIAKKPGLQGILYDSVSYLGKRVQVFAYYGVPEGEAPAGGWPAVVCVHGGGGTAFDEWVQRWNLRGYAAISMDLEGNTPLRQTPDDAKSTRIPTQNPGPARGGVFNDFAEPINEQWYYHAVSQVILAHSLTRSFPEVNPDKVGITGISWGGTLTSTIMGVDPRFKFAIPVYGCGFLPDGDGHQGEAIKPGEHTRVVLENFDGSAYFENVKIPTFWVNGTNDMHFPMPSTQASSRAVKGPAMIRYELEMPHGHGPGWRPEEIYAFADSVVKGGTPLVRFFPLHIVGNQASVNLETVESLASASLWFTRDFGAWPQRKWHRVAAKVAGNVLSAEIPEGTVACFFSATDQRGLMTTSEFKLREN